MVARFTDRKGAEQAKKYFAAAEKAEGREETPPRWFGRGAERLGLAGTALRSVFNRLIDNRRPDGKGKLTERGGHDHNIKLYEITFNAQKSFSLAAEFGPEADRKILRDAFTDAVMETMTAAVEPKGATRVRRGNAQADRRTAELTGTLYLHVVNRANQPHLHAHATVHNHTWDQEEQKYKALKVHDIWCSAPAIEADFQQRLRSKVQAAGFRTRSTATEFRKEHGMPKEAPVPAYCWELVGVPQPLMDRFSERRQSIKELYAERKGQGKRITPKLRKAAATLTRDPKHEVVDLDKLRGEWLGQMTEKEREAFRYMRARPKVGRPLMQPTPLKKHLALVHKVATMAREIAREQEREISYERG